jgi:hypothetical protein
MAAVGPGTTVTVIELEVVEQLAPADTTAV